MVLKIALMGHCLHFQKHMLSSRNPGLQKRSAQSFIYKAMLEQSCSLSQALSFGWKMHTLS